MEMSVRLIRARNASAWTGRHGNNTYLLSGAPGARTRRHPFEENGPFPAGDGQLLPLHTPGHAPDHVSFFEPSARDLHCGDLIRTGGSIVIPASQGGSVRLYLESLRLMRDLAPRRLLPGHGDIVDQPAPLIEQFIATAKCANRRWLPRSRRRA